MEKRITGDTLQRYSFRKLSVGLVSATIGSFFLSTAIGGNISTVEAAEVSAGKTVPVQYHYVVESELTEAEKNAVVKELPKFVEENFRQKVCQRQATQVCGKQLLQLLD